MLCTVIGKLLQTRLMGGGGYLMACWWPWGDGVMLIGPALVAQWRNLSTCQLLRCTSEVVKMQEICVYSGEV